MGSKVRWAIGIAAAVSGTLLVAPGTASAQGCFNSADNSWCSYDDCVIAVTSANPDLKKDYRKWVCFQSADNGRWYYNWNG
ncbi:hypothetical protein ACFVMC_10510 [Nocardia sp. NPDC127579]|uniref:hypothetical protein n=1 Tax=Nocardia sp. NPDC127579 TaxID=3345402 RepID=UPI00362D36CA